MFLRELYEERTCSKPVENKETPNSKENRSNQFKEIVATTPPKTSWWRIGIKLFWMFVWIPPPHITYYCFCKWPWWQHILINRLIFNLCLDHIIYSYMWKPWIIHNYNILQYWEEAAGDFQKLRFYLCQLNIIQMHQRVCMITKKV